MALVGRLLTRTVQRGWQHRYVVWPHIGAQTARYWNINSLHRHSDFKLIYCLPSMESSAWPALRAGPTNRLNLGELEEIESEGGCGQFCDYPLRNVVSECKHVQETYQPLTFNTRSRALSTGNYDIKTVGVVGLGSMGHGVAQLAAVSGFKVLVSETSQSSLDSGIGAIEKSLTFLAGKRVAKGDIEQAAADAEVSEVMGRISGEVGLAQLTAESDLVIEAIVEDLKIKLPFFEELGRTTKV